LYKSTSNKIHKAPLQESPNKSRMFCYHLLLFLSRFSFQQSHLLDKAKDVTFSLQKIILALLDKIHKLPLPLRNHSNTTDLHLNLLSLSLHKYPNFNETNSFFICIEKRKNKQNYLFLLFCLLSCITLFQSLVTVIYNGSPRKTLKKH